MRQRGHQGAAPPQSSHQPGVGPPRLQIPVQPPQAPRSTTKGFTSDYSPLSLDLSCRQDVIQARKEAERHKVLRGPRLQPSQVPLKSFQIPTAGHVVARTTTSSCPVQSLDPQTSTFVSTFLALQSSLAALDPRTNLAD